jgi:hypothetical protein
VVGVIEYVTVRVPGGGLPEGDLGSRCPTPWCGWCCEDRFWLECLHLAVREDRVLGLCGCLGGALRLCLSRGL